MTGLAAVSVLCASTATAVPQPLASYTVDGDAIPRSLTGASGDPGKGAALIADRQKSLCTLCHAGPFADAHLQGTVGPDLAAVGLRLSEGQLRLRIVDMSVLHASTIMPAYYKIEDHPRVGAPWRGKPLLTAAEIEDIVAYLVTLKD